MQETWYQGITIEPKKYLWLEVYADTKFIGNYKKSTSQFDTSPIKSRSGFTIIFCAFTIIWTSKLKTSVHLSSCESEYYAWSQSLREAIQVMELLKEINNYIFSDKYIPGKVYCNAFVYNPGALHMKTVHKVWPRTKHINNQYQNFREHARNKVISVHNILTK